MPSKTQRSKHKLQCTPHKLVLRWAVEVASSLTRDIRGSAEARNNPVAAEVRAEMAQEVQARKAAWEVREEEDTSMSAISGTHRTSVEWHGLKTFSEVSKWMVKGSLLMETGGIRRLAHIA